MRVYVCFFIVEVHCVKFKGFRLVCKMKYIVYAPAVVVVDHTHGDGEREGTQ